jgi:hypothetical protein
MRILKSVLVGMSALAIAGPPAVAQQPKPQVKPQPRVQRHADAGGHTLQQLGYELLTKPQEMGGIPMPQNSQFLYGQVKRENTGEVGIAQRFAVRNSMNDIVPYYKATLENLGWKISSSNAYRLTARRKADAVTVQAMPSHVTGYTSELYLALRMGKGG